MILILLVSCLNFAAICFLAVKLYSAHHDLNAIKVLMVSLRFDLNDVRRELERKKVAK